MITVAGNVLLILAAIPATGAALLYGFRVTWWRSRWGRHLFTYMTAVALVTDLGIVRLAFGDRWWFAALRAGAYGLVVIALWWRLAFVYQAYREGSPDESPAPDEKEIPRVP